MKYIKTKIFWKNEDGQKNISFITWDEAKQEYYTFIKEFASMGYHQITITTEIMLEYLKYIIEMPEVSITGIEMMEEDSEIEEELNAIVNRCRDNRAAYVALIDYLRFISEESSIEIKKIEYIFRGEKRRDMMFIQVNGLVGISDANSYMLKTLKKVVSRYLI